MKNQLLLICSLFVTSLSFAQEPLSFGIKAGANFSSASGFPDLFEVSGRVGFHLGAIANISITDKIGLQPEVYYSRQGYTNGPIEVRGFFDQAPVVFDIRENLDYINVPVLLDFELVEGLTVQTGPQLGLSVGTSADFINVEGNENDIPEDTFGPGVDASTVEFGWAGGLQFSFSNFFVQGRYVFGLSSIFDEGSDIKNRNAQLSFGYMFL